MKLKDLKATTVEQEIALKNAILFVRCGSHMYGTRTPNSDEDFVGIFIEPREYVLGRKRLDEVSFDTNPSGSGRVNNKEDVDVKLYSLNKWIKLASNNNPNILELFFTPENCILDITPLGKELMDKYELFVSQKNYHSFKGYAHAQMAKLKTKGENKTGRISLIEKHGFDTKMAHHNLRLYLECFQLLKSGRIEFPLAENNMLLNVKNGKWSFDEFLKKSEELSQMCSIAMAGSTIRYSPNEGEIDKLQISLYERMWRIPSTIK